MEMLEESIEVMGKLWAGGQTSHHGTHYTVENARLYTLPDELPPVVASAFGPQTAVASAKFADGFWSVGPQDVLDTYREEGGDGSAYTQLTVCYADSEDEAVETAHEYWRQSALPGELNQLLPTPTHFEQATRVVTKEDIREGTIITDPDPQGYIESVEACVEAGYDHVYFHQVGDDQAAFFEFAEDELLPALR